jgi:predicted short-subunit dehydrogenase-like oxidoreductase (DUF2520 family)
MARALAHAVLKSSDSAFILEGIYARSADKAESLKSTLPEMASSEIRSGGLNELNRNEKADITFLAVSDSAIAEVAARMAENGGSGSALLVHTSGACGFHELDVFRKKGGRIGSFHPLQSIAADSGAEVFKDISISILSDDESSSELLSRLARSFGANPLPVDERQKKKLHLAAVMASNYMVALHHLAELVAGEVEGDLLQHFKPLLQQTLDNIIKKGPAAALTGPASRGDGGTLSMHLAELDAITKQNLKASSDRTTNIDELLSAYRLLGRVATRLAVTDGRLSEAQSLEICDLLKPEHQN